MDRPKTRPEINTRTFEGRLDDLREAHQRLGAQVRKLEGAARLSEGYHDCLAEICTLMIWLEGLATDVKTEMERLDNQLPDDSCRSNYFELLPRPMLPSTLRTPRD